jgi:hypothetical protein
MRVGNYNGKSLEERPMLSTSTTGANTGYVINFCRPQNGGD